MTDPRETPIPREALIENIAARYPDFDPGLAAVSRRCLELETENERQRIVIGLKQRQYDRLNLCPDHRDKATGRCLACQVESNARVESLDTLADLRRQVETLTQERDEAKGRAAFWETAAATAHDKLASQPREAAPTCETWQPIETAPRDGTLILAVNVEWTEPEVARWSRLSNCWVTWDHSVQPTHWLLWPALPSRPTSTEGQ